MFNSHKLWLIAFLGACVLLTLAGVASAADMSIPGVKVSFDGGKTSPQDVSSALKIVLGLTVLSLAPAILVSMTAFTRIVIVLSMIRHGLGMQETPPNTVIVSLALFLTLFTMTPVLTEINTRAYQPYMDGKIGTEAALAEGIKPLRQFMVRQTRESDLALMVEISKSESPKTIDDISIVQLIPAFMLSELKSAFQIGFVVFLPFLLIDLIVATVLMSMGMVMVPPVMVSLPLKILMFVLIDGWNIVVKSLISSFH
jgi:flagellar biosynthetic protein FliP